MKRKTKFPVFVQRLEHGEILALKLIPENIYGDKKLTGRLPDLTCFRQATAGYDAVHMHMIIQFLVPGMKHLDDPGCCPEPLLISRQFKKCFGTASVKKTIQKLLVTIN